MIIDISFFFINISGIMIYAQDFQNEIGNPSNIINKSKDQFIVNSLNDTTIQFIVNSLNDTTIQSIVNSLNDTTIQSIVNSLNGTLISSINSLMANDRYQNIITGGASIASAISAFILYFSFRSQNKLIKSQIEYNNATTKKIKEEHYQNVKELLNTILQNNLSFLGKTLSEEYNTSLTNLKIYYDSNSIRHYVKSQYIDIHLKNDYPTLDSHLDKIDELKNNIDNKVDELENRLIEITKQKLSDFELVKYGVPRIYEYLSKYWLKKVIIYEKDRNIEKFNLTFKGIKEEGTESEEDYKKNNCCVLRGGDGVFFKTKSTDREDFFSKVDDLIRDKNIWSQLEQISNLRIGIKNIIIESNNILEHIITQIDRREYKKEFSCCRLERIQERIFML